MMIVRLKAEDDHHDDDESVRKKIFKLHVWTSAETKETFD